MYFQTRKTDMNWIKIATVDQIDEDESLAVELDGKQLAVHHTEGEFFVTDNICSHQYALLSDGFLEDGCIECPLHQAKFDLRTGQALCAPATEPVKVYETRIEGDDLLINL
jgi:3-phenylpropionate/trans-cinnamate dioxygenase ferredoxin subunit